jgi:hypothetical protein
MASNNVRKFTAGVVAVVSVPFFKLFSTTGGNTDVSALDTFAANNDKEMRKFVKRIVDDMEVFSFLDDLEIYTLRTFCDLAEFIAVAKQLLANHGLTLDSLPLAANGIRNRSHTNLGDCGRASMDVIQEASRYVETALRPKGATVVTRTVTRTSSTATDGTVVVETTVVETVVSHHGITRGGNARGAIKNGKRIPNRSNPKVSEV